MRDDGRCYVEGCDADGQHETRWTIACSEEGWMGGGETEVDAWFCCAHFDQLTKQRHGQPFVDVIVVGRVREAVPV